MFNGSKQPEKIINNIVKNLSDHSRHKSHARHINIDECKKIGLKISELENDQELQDLVLTVHHSYIHTLASTAAYKIVENHNGVAMVQLAQILQVKQPG